MLLVASCGDCVQEASGKVMDSTTNQPVIGAMVYKKQRRLPDTTVTDSTGQFKLSSISGGLFHCPAMDVVIEHPNYKTVETSIGAGRFKEIKLAPSNK